MLAGVGAAVPCFQQKIGRVVKSRITWLVLLFVAETATGTVLRHFEDELAKVVALSFFIPLHAGRCLELVHLPVGRAPDDLRPWRRLSRRGLVAAGGASAHRPAPSGGPSAV